MTSDKTVDETKVEDASKPESKPVDERAVTLANQQEAAIAKSAAMEGEIEANKKLSVYAAAGLAHVDTVKLWKASLDYACEKRGVASTWTPAQYDSAVGQITVRIRATNPELFEDFDALKEKPSKAPSNSNERIHTRLKVGAIYKSLVELCGDGVGNLPYRTVANYLVSDRIFNFSKQDVTGTIRPEHVEFLKTQLGMIISGKSTSASFVAALKGHYDDLDKEAEDKALANLTPDQRKARETAKKAAEEGRATVDAVSKIRKGLVTYLAQAMPLMPPEDIAKMVTDAAKASKTILPIGNNDPTKITVDGLKAYLEMVATKGGRSNEERIGLRKTIISVGQMLSEQANKRREAKLAKMNGKTHQLAASI